ncbi:cytochrome P450 [Dendrothele bispora CBS 962.96]|uniref:Cytochrome P450 n=1 Tax=Dendrothele bispora (strain CBS 962.96) TaxID=1314807 RepID=A0A4S8MRQ6_DENBC|nr:cytochrome P450 [Dendrothele bispora CBS 962.96]
MYEKHGSAIISSVLIPKSMPVYWLVDAQAIKTVANDKGTFDKDIGFYKNGLDFFGENIIFSQYNAWRRHRIISNPAFNEAIYSVVWQETFRAVNDWFSELGTKASSDGEYTFNAIHSFSEITFLVFARAGFGAEASSASSDLYKVLQSAIYHSTPRTALPDWLFTISDRFYIPFVSPYLRATQNTFRELERLSMEAVSHVRAELLGKSSSTTGGALLRNLVKANMDADGNGSDRRALTDKELMSNMFIFLTAGHETSANAISFAIALLALYPDVQKKVLDEVTALWPDTAPDYADDAVYTTAVFHEAMRLFPIAPRLGRVVTKDTVLKSYKFDPSDPSGSIEPYSVPMKQGSEVVMDISALHRNPVYWGNDVDDFKPERFIDTDDYHWPRDAFLGFSIGHRTCLGQRFAIVEAVAILALTVRNYQVLVPPKLRGKPFEEQKKHLLKYRPVITNGLVNDRVTFKKRD